MRHSGTIAHLKQIKQGCSLGHKIASWDLVESKRMI